MEILNLEVFENKKKAIKLDGVEYEIPGEIPMLLHFRLLKSQKDGDLDRIEEGVEILYEIFKIMNPKLELLKFTASMTQNKYTAILNFLFANMTIEDTLKSIAQTDEELKDGKKKPPIAVT